MGEGTQEFSSPTPPAIHESKAKTPIPSAISALPESSIPTVASSQSPDEKNHSEAPFDKSIFNALYQTVESLSGRYNLSESKLGKLYKSVRYIGDRKELSDARLKQLTDTLHAQTSLLQKALKTDEYFDLTLHLMNRLMFVSRKKHANELSKFSAFFVQQNLPYIETVLSETHDKDKIQTSINAAYYLTFFGDKSQSISGIDFLLRNFEPILQSSKDTLLFRDQLTRILSKGNDAQLESASQIARRLIKDTDPNIRKFAGEEISNAVGAHGLHYEPARRIAKDILREYGIDYSSVVKAWADSGPHSDFINIVNKNLRMIFDLESQRPGMVKVLIDDYKIYDFARYPTEMLVEEYDQRDNKDIPYGVIFFPRSDWNGAFYNDREVFRKLGIQLKETGYGLRIFEVASKFDIVRAVIKLNKRYGQDHKISFAIIGGHGTWEDIQFGSNRESLDIFDIKNQHGATSNNYLLKQDDLKGRGAKRIIEFFEPNPTIILSSCSTGVNRGIVQEMSKLGAKVIGPDRDKNLSKIKVGIGNDGNLIFKVNYYGPFLRKTTQEYNAGQKK